MKKIIIVWVFTSCLVTLTLGSTYILVQQMIRQSANDPQIQMAEDGTKVLAMGGVPAEIVPRQIIDMSQSLASFTMVFDSQGNVLESSMRVGDTLPVPPSGVFEYARIHGGDKFTWQPQKGVRAAVVVKYYKNDKSSGFVLAGRSLREVEIREDNLLSLALFSWVVSVIATLILSGLLYWFK